MYSRTLTAFGLMTALSAQASIGVPKYPKFIEQWASVSVNYPDPNASIQHTGAYFIDALKGPHFTIDDNASWSVDDDDQGRLEMVPKVLGKHSFVEEVLVTSGALACNFSIMYDLRRVRLHAASIGEAYADCRSSLHVDGDHNAIRFFMK
ncbi:Uncharacterised protein [Pseudomonas putida]|uniref:hypothetical protein n=1 Tax=Pseudomonas guariconensis TaxID=1288410 RepID=UPI001F877FB7|nr:Uncharacterised protein [Pseudomonas putida]CAB5539458.1 Uncharacterised protein [Pseudomonas putida]CAB5580201.1 Uncharacterised protein [Pseudomonas putida]CAB5588568.1 Uncharacterised protein [Pseudomonas putida]CAB5667661.1 Uncharacterised protein [Pseudomonas putida]